jgi:hypothetical protein
VAIDAWTAAASITEGEVFRSINKAGKVWGDGMTPKVLREVVLEAAGRAGIEKLAPHDLRRYAECRIMPNRNQDLRFGAWSASIRMKGLGMIRMAKAASGRPVVRHPAGIESV